MEGIAETDNTLVNLTFQLPEDKKSINLFPIILDKNKNPFTEYLMLKFITSVYDSIAGITK